LKKKRECNYSGEIEGHTGEQKFRKARNCASREISRST